MRAKETGLDKVSKVLTQVYVPVQSQNRKPLIKSEVCLKLAMNDI